MKEHTFDRSKKQSKKNIESKNQNFYQISITQSTLDFLSKNDHEALYHWVSISKVKFIGLNNKDLYFIVEANKEIMTLAARYLTLILRNHIGSLENLEKLEAYEKYVSIEYINHPCLSKKNLREITTKGNVLLIELRNKLAIVGEDENRKKCIELLPLFPKEINLTLPSKSSLYSGEKHKLPCIYDEICPCIEEECKKEWCLLPHLEIKKLRKIIKNQYTLKKYTDNLFEGLKATIKLHSGARNSSSTDSSSSAPTTVIPNVIKNKIGTNTVSGLSFNLKKKSTNTMTKGKKRKAEENLNTQTKNTQKKSKFILDKNKPVVKATVLSKNGKAIKNQKARTLPPIQAPLSSPGRGRHCSAPGCFPAYTRKKKKSKSN